MKSVSIRGNAGRLPHGTRVPRAGGGTILIWLLETRFRLQGDTMVGQLVGPRTLHRDMGGVVDLVGHTAQGKNCLVFRAI
ncbi:hypothetical protein FOQG_18814 [Fusarium oxysporum f. sp. raphani 54005]|uniref:Uncharacterized protein n=1 Tax=Fusarium oxysporum f. sp. raphani 54005 TaxID=1089458 RepID=X0B2U1_FUSOX|nr:hypothetical protein FOQG_18814 [Fusarium oxysporum f. sp. raphani 54005]